MKLVTHLQQGRLLFFHDLGYRLTVEENQYFRWLSFSDLPQSVMHMRQPYWLTLPHHFYLILPLALIKPANIVEIGLGGGNLSRYLLRTLPQTTLTSFESESAVIRCFEQFFTPAPSSYHKIIHSSSSADILTKAKNTDWLIYDVFSPEEDSGINLSLVKLLLVKTPDIAWVTFNLPDLLPKQLDLVLREFQKLVGQKRMYYFFVPHYKNIVVHIGPEPSEQRVSALPIHTLKRAQKLWQHACLNRQLKGHWPIV